MTTDYNKKRYLQLLDQRSIGDNSNDDELLLYSCMLTNQLDWEIRDQYLSLMEKFLNGNISMPEFFAELRIKTYAIIDAVGFLEEHRILLSFDKEASKFEELLEDITDQLEGDLSYTGDEFKNFIQENYIKIKKYLNEVELNAQIDAEIEAEEAEIKIKANRKEKILLERVTFFGLVSLIFYSFLKSELFDLDFNFIN